MTTPAASQQQIHQKQLKTKRKIKLQVTTPAPVDIIVDSNETVYTAPLHTTTTKNPMNNNTAVTAPKNPFQVASHLKFATCTTVRKLKTKAKLVLTALTKINHKHNSTAQHSKTQKRSYSIQPPPIDLILRPIFPTTYPRLNSRVHTATLIYHRYHHRYTHCNLATNPNQRVRKTLVTNHTSTTPTPTKLL